MVNSFKSVFWFIALFLPSMIVAEPLRNGEVVGDWRFSCVALGESKTRCTLQQTIFSDADAPPLAQIAFERASDADYLIVSLVVPIGSEIPSGALLAAGEAAFNLPYIYCSSERCLARALVAHESLLPFLSSDKLAVVYKRYGVEGMLRIPASSNGLKDAFARLRLANSE